jgi:hypothetical protein
MISNLRPDYPDKYDMQPMLRKHIFYHADRDASLKEGQEILLDENDLSYFGRVYWPVFISLSYEEMTPTQQREYYLECIRSQPGYSSYPSRMQSMFAANTIPEAIVFATSIEPLPAHPVPIIEIYADRFWTLDSNWLDYVGTSNRDEKYRSYWEAIITNHRPEEGERRSPRLEVMIALPATAGKIVHLVRP